MYIFCLALPIHFGSLCPHNDFHQSILHYYMKKLDLNISHQHEVYISSLCIVNQARSLFLVLDGFHVLYIPHDHRQSTHFPLRV